MRVRVQLDGVPRKQTLGGPAGISIALHMMLVALAVFPLGFSKSRVKWGDAGAGGGAATAVTLKPGIPLPAAPVENPVATDTKSQNLPELPSPKTTKKIEPPPSKNDFEIQDKKRQKREMAELLRKEVLKDLKQAENAVPGTGGRAGSTIYGSMNTSQGQGGMNFGGDFGSRYGWYVQQVRQCISANWDRGRVDASVRSAPKVFVGFDINRDGTIVAEHVTTSSGIPSFDREAIRAVQACSGHSGSDRHLPALPKDFDGNKVTVEVWFDSKQ